MAQKRAKNRSSLILMAGIVLLALAGVALLISYFSIDRQPAARLVAATPLDAVNAPGVAPDLAVLTLAGENDDRIIRAARDAGELETAYAGLAYSSLLPDSARGGLWLLLGGDYTEADPGRALLAYRAAMDVAGLAPALSDLARAEISLQAADGFAALEQPEAAGAALAQADQIARHGLSLLPAQRRSVLVGVVDALRSMGDDDAAQALNGQLAAAAQGPGVQVEPPTSLLPALRGSVVLPQELAVAIAARQSAAAELAARWLLAGDEERAALAATLGGALEAEDRARLDAYGRLGSLSQADQLALLHDQIAWLTVKYRVARGGYGATLVPAWEADAESIRQALVAAYTELINGYGRQIDTLDPEQVADARVELLGQGLLASRLGLFPGDVEQPLGDQLFEASQQLRSQMGDAGLSLAPRDAAGLRFYTLSGPDAFAGERAETQPGG